jgi:hypothetical protein
MGSGMAVGFLARLATLWTRRRFLAAPVTNSMLEVEATTGFEQRRRRNGQMAVRSAMADSSQSSFFVRARFEWAARSADTPSGVDTDQAAILEPRFSRRLLLLATASVGC